MVSQVDLVGKPEMAPVGGESSAGRGCKVMVRADGCHVETDPNAEILRPLECIKL